MIGSCFTQWLVPMLAPGEKLMVFLVPARASDPDLELAQRALLLDAGVCEVNELRQWAGLPANPEQHRIQPRVPPGIGRLN